MPGQTLPLPAGILNLVLTAGRDRLFTATVAGASLTGTSHLAQFRETSDLNSNVLFELSSSGSNPQITVSDQVVTFQILASDTADLAGKTIYWAWKVEFDDETTNDWLEGYVAIEATPTA